MRTTSCDALDVLSCPIDGSKLSLEGDWVRGVCGHRFPVVEGVPVLLRDDVPQTIEISNRSLALARRWVDGLRDDPVFVDTLGLSPQERSQVRSALTAKGNKVDPVISHLVAATNGILYKRVAGKLDSVPIPETRLPTGNGKRIIDVGCNWGRWSLAAAEIGYRPIGIDPSLGAVLSAKRLAALNGFPFEGVVADARYLPLSTSSVDAAFSYSVLQHFAKDDARRAFSEISRVVRADGLVRIQMASMTGIRSLHHIVRRGFREPRGFDVRYWWPTALLRDFRRAFGDGDIEVDCYFGLGLQASDRGLYGRGGRALMALSDCLRDVSNSVPLLKLVADSIYLVGRNSAPHPNKNTAQKEP